MPTVTGNSTARIIRWGSDDVSVRYFDVYRRADNVTANLTTADVIAKVGFGSNHFVDIVNGNTPYWYWVKAISWAGNSSAYSDTITAEVSSSDLVVGGNITVCGTTTLNGTLSVNAAANISGALTVDGAATLRDSLTVSGILSVNNNVNISGSATVDGATILKSTLTVNGVTKINSALNVTGAATFNGPTAVNNTLIVSGTTTLLGQVLVGTQCGEATAAIGLYRPWTANTSGHYGVHINELIAQATPNTTALSCTGLGGFVSLTNALFGAAYSVYCLDLMPYELNVVCGHTAYVSTYGIRTGGAAGFGGTFNALSICGLDVGMVGQAGIDYGSNVNAKTGYGILIENGAGFGGTKTIGTAYQIYINGISSATPDANKWAIWADNGKSYFRQNVSGAAGDVMHFHQDHAAGAIGCLKMTQDHQGYDFMHFVAAASAGTSYSINTTERNTFNCMIAIKVNGVKRWLKVYA